MLKRLLSVLLLLIFLFNLGGYYVMFSALSVQANRELSARLDVGQYDEQKTITIDIPFSLPYPIQDSDFERFRQSFSIGDENYQVVKQKYENDVLTIVCIRDHKSDDLNDVLRTIDEQQSGEKGPVSISVKAVQEYVSSSEIIMTGHRGWSQSIGTTGYLSFEPTAPANRFHGPPRA